MKVKVFIVEDEVILADEIEECLTDIGYEVVGNVIKGENAIELIKSIDVDIILMDIKLKGTLDGIETVKRIQEYKNPPIIYLTDLKKKKVWEKAKTTNPAAYLIKPFNKIEVDIAFQIALKNVSEKNSYNLDPKQKIENINSKTFQIDDRVYLRKGTKFIRILQDEILYVKGSGSYSDVYTHNEKYTLTYNLTQLAKRIPFENLIRIHKSYIINLDEITSIEGNRVFIKDIEIPIGGTYKEALMDKLRLI